MRNKGDWIPVWDYGLQWAPRRQSSSLEWLCIENSTQKAKESREGEKRGEKACFGWKSRNQGFTCPDFPPNSQCEHLHPTWLCWLPQAAAGRNIPSQTHFFWPFRGGMRQSWDEMISSPLAHALVPVELERSAPWAFTMGRRLQGSLLLINLHVENTIFQKQMGFFSVICEIFPRLLHLSERVKAPKGRISMGWLERSRYCWELQRQRWKLKIMSI